MPKNTYICKEPQIILKMKKTTAILAAALAAATLCFTACTDNSGAPEAEDTVIGAYVMGIRGDIPDTRLVTHINFAFAHVNESFDGVLLPDSDGLRKIARLKKRCPRLKVLLSVGGWGSGRFSEMAADSLCRLSFARDCARMVDEYRIDGIDIDWEYPTRNSAGISSSENDTENFTLLMRDLRESLGSGRLLTLASVCTAKYVDFRAILPYVDYVNVMAYDMNDDKYGHHSALYRSENSGTCTADEAVKLHLEAGVPADKIVMGMPFYGRGKKGCNLDSEGVTEVWDDVAKVPLLFDTDGNRVFGHENVRSLTEKCNYIKDNGLRGGMYWEYNADDPSHTFAKTVHDNLVDRKAI